MKNLLKQRSNWLKFVHLGWKRKWLLIKVSIVLTAYKCLLLLLPFNYFTKAAKTVMPAGAAPSERYLNDLVWAITVVSNRVPLGFTCLVQALSAKWLLKAYPDVRLCIGVHKNKTTDFSAHAWIVYKDRTILGGQTAQLFEPILEWS